jgi:hypothetical protein
VLRKKSYVPFVPGGEVLLTSAGMSLVMGTYAQNPEHLSGLVRRIVYQVSWLSLQPRIDQESIVFNKLTFSRLRDPPFVLSYCSSSVVTKVIKAEPRSLWTPVSR